MRPSAHTEVECVLNGCRQRGAADPFTADPTNTQDYNRYSYVNNNPLTYIDPSGYDERAVLLLGVLLRRVARSYWQDDQDWLLRVVSEERQGVVRSNGVDRRQSP